MPSLFLIRILLLASKNCLGIIKNKALLSRINSAEGTRFDGGSQKSEVLDDGAPDERTGVQVGVE